MPVKESIEIRKFFNVVVTKLPDPADEIRRHYAGKKLFLPILCNIMYVSVFFERFSF